MFFKAYLRYLKEIIKLDNQTYQILEEIGEGGYAKVFKAIKNRKEQVALSLLTQFYQDNVDLFISLQECKWRNCVLPKGVFEQDRKHLYIESELYDGDISKHKFNEERINRMIIHISTALQDIHSDNYIHCDVKPQNILYKENYYALCDFGSIQKKGSKKEALGTMQYMPPETYSEEVDQSADIWALGLTIFEVIQGESFFVNDGIELQQKKSDQEYIEKRISQVKNDKFRNLIENTVRIEKNERMTAQQIISFMSDITATIPNRVVPKHKNPVNRKLSLSKRINFKDFIKSQKYLIPNNYYFQYRKENIELEQIVKQFSVKINDSKISQIPIIQNQKKKIKVYQTNYN